MQTLIEQLGSSDLVTRRHAAEELAFSVENPAAASVALCLVVSDEDEEVRESATVALENITAPVQQDLQSLVDLLSAQQSDTGFWAATLIGRLGVEANSAVTEIAAVLQDINEPIVVARIAWALGKIGPAAAAALPALEALLSSDHPRVVRSAKQAIDQISH